MCVPCELITSTMMHLIIRTLCNSILIFFSKNTLRRALYVTGNLIKGSQKRMDLRQNSKYIKKKYALAIFRGILWTCIDDSCSFK